MTDVSRYRMIERCRGCGATPDLLREVFRMDPMPLAGQFCASEAEARAAAMYPLTFVMCSRCGLAQVLEDIPDAMLFRTYNYRSSTVPALVRHFDAYAREIAARYRGSVRLLEIGCNDGILLRRLPASWHLFGVDPSDVAARAMPGPYELVNEPFSSDVGRRLAKRGTFDVVTSSNALAHVTDIRNLIEGAWRALRPDGELLIEVHDLDAAGRGGHWDVIYHEHKAEWTARSLSTCVSAVGFEPLAIDHLDLHGGLLRARFRRVDRPPHAFGRPAPEHDLAELAAAYRGRRRSQPYRRATAVAESGGTVAAYGASGRGNVWLNQLPELPIAYVVDDSPLRSGRWIPRVAIPIVSAAELERRPPALCVVTAWNHIDDIQRRAPGAAGEWVPTFTPAPEVSPGPRG